MTQRTMDEGSCLGACAIRVSVDTKEAPSHFRVDQFHLEASQRPESLQHRTQHTRKYSQISSSKHIFLEQSMTMHTT